MAFTTRVSSLLTIFLGRLDRPFNTDTLDPKQGVELKWRELTGMTQPDDLETLLTTELPRMKDRVLASGRPGAGAAATTIDVILTLLDRSIDELERCTRIAGSALRVAIEMDRAAAAPPAGQRSWAAFELRGQADLVDQVADAAGGFSSDFIYDLRREVGAESMAYRSGMKGLATA